MWNLYFKYKINCQLNIYFSSCTYAVTLPGLCLCCDRSALIKGLPVFPPTAAVEHGYRSSVSNAETIQQTNMEVMRLYFIQFLIFIVYLL